jgi:hypothetical protein
MMDARVTKRTIANTPTASVRCTGKLRCACGTFIRASDLTIIADDGAIDSMRITCPGCHADLLAADAQ